MSRGITFIHAPASPDHVVGQVLATLQQGPPWDLGTGLPTNPTTCQRYTGITALMLHVITKRNRLHSKYWTTADEWSKCGGRVVGPGHEVPFEAGHVLHWTRLWNVSEVRGADRFRVRSRPKSHWDRMARLLETTGATVIHSNCPHAIYEPPRPWGDFPNHAQGDYIELPPPTACSPARYWHNISHELIHWAEVRTGWLCMDDAKRELVAEIGAAWLLRSLGLPGDGDHLNFWDWLPQWRKAMLSDREWLFEAVGQVERVVNFLLPP